MKQTQFGSNSWKKKILEPLVYYRCWKVWDKPVNMIRKATQDIMRSQGGTPPSVPQQRLIDSYPPTEIALEEVRSPLKKLQQHSG